MKTMINSIILASCLALPLASCSDSDAAPEQKDWSTTTYFNSSDAAAQDLSLIHISEPTRPY